MLISLRSPWETYFEGTLKSGVEFSIVGAAGAVVSAAPLSVVALSFAAGWGVVIFSKIVELGLERLGDKYQEKRALFRILRDLTPIVFSLAVIITFFALSLLQVKPFLVLGFFMAAGMLMQLVLGALGTNVKRCIEKS